MFKDFDVAASGMAAQRVRLNTISSNIANVNTTRGPNGEAYKRRDVLFAAAPNFKDMLTPGAEANVPVMVNGIIEDPRPMKVVYEPGHPDSNEEGYLTLPNVNVVEEMVNMISAMRAYEANVTAFKSAKDMKMKALDLGR